MGSFQVIMLSFFAYYCFNTRKKKASILGFIILLIHIPLFVNMISNKESTAQYSFFWESDLYAPDMIMFETDNVLNVTDNGMNATDNDFD